MNQNNSFSPGLYLVATPIGNLRDITLRALDVLRAADTILCEDKRVTQNLLNAYGIHTKLGTYHDYSRISDRSRSISQMKEGKIVALVSDAGMPLISDPGYKLVQACYQDNVPVTSLPGANAPLTALQLSGLPSDQFSFLGFIPTKQTARKILFEQWRDHPGTLIFFEAKSRILKSLNDAREIMGENRQCCLARELTKKFEEVITGSLSELVDHCGSGQDMRGEFVLLIGPAYHHAWPLEEMDAAVQKALRSGDSIKTLSAEIARQSGWAKRDVYQRALELRD